MDRSVENILDNYAVNQEPDWETLKASKVPDVKIPQFRELDISLERT